MPNLMNVLLGGFCVASVVLATCSADADDQSSSPEIPAAEQPFWENAQAFVDAYASRDAGAIAELFTEDVEFYDEFGELSVGREAIMELFSAAFESSPEAMIEQINLDRVRFITDQVAFEEGMTVSTESPGAAPQSSRYVALHVKGDDGTWRINTLKSFGQHGGGRAEHLDQLIWLVGDWVSEQTDAVVKTSCRWSDDGHYLLRNFSIQNEGATVMGGVQRIGWDSQRRQIRSWTFDSEGGFVEGVWTRNGNEWIVTTSGVTADGESASGTAVFTIVDGEMVTWQYRNLVIGNELREDLESITMVRRPPSPATSASN